MEVTYVKIEKYLKNIGPGAIITAAFIGPGTVTTCIKSGYETGYSLLGVMVFAIIVAIFIQIFAAKVGIITQMGISKNIRENTHSVIGRMFSIFLITMAIFIGNSAFEAGNITGAVIGLTGIVGNSYIIVKVMVISVIVFILLWNGKYEKIEFILEMAVVLMALCFIIAAILIKPDIGHMMKEMLSIKLFHSDTMMTGALIGTTIGPYSILLHSEIAAECWHSPSDFKYMIFDTVMSIGVGGIISCCIMIVAATTAKELQITELTINNFALALSTPIGRGGQLIFYIGLIAAGVTSAITAPLAAAYIITGICFSEKIDKRCGKFKMVWCFVLCIGAVISMIWGNSPAEIILVVQLANAIILPLIMIFLYKCLNNKKMKQHKNSTLANIVLIVLIVVCFFLSFRDIYQIMLS